MKHAVSALLASVSLASAMPMISEVMSNNTKTLLDEDNQYSDWIEISNPTASAIRLEKYYLTDDPTKLDKWEFPKVDVPANGFLIVFASGKDRADPARKLHTNFKLSADGEWLALVDPDGKKIVNSVNVPVLKDDTSISLIDSSGVAVYGVTEKPTPNAANNKDVVLFSARGRTFVDAWKLTLTSPSGGQIIYSTDGKTPDANSGGVVYSEPIEVNKSMILSARVNNGPVQQETFIQIDAAMAGVTSNLPLIVVDSPKTISSQTALTDMAIGIIEPSGDDKRAKMLGEFTVNSRGAIRVRGETSAGNPKRPYRVEFWNSEGRDRQLDVFGMGAESDWLLNMQQTFDSTLMHNAWIYKMSNEMGRYAVETKFVELYHNQKADGPVAQADYAGVYEWMENISRGPNRLDIAGLPIGYDIKLVAASAEADIPADGKVLAVVAKLDGKLKFRVFDETGARVVDVDESALPNQASKIAELAKKLEPLWNSADVSAEKAGLISSVSSIVSYPMSYEGRSEPSISGGYMFKQDKDDPKTWVANGGSVSIQIIYPPEEEKALRKHQQDWLVAYLNKVRTATASSDPVTGYKAFVDEGAWIDHHWLGFLPLNVDALRLSAYFYKDRNDKLAAGPIWDFDRSAGGPSDDRVVKPNVWRATTGDLGTHFFNTPNSTPVWWANLFKQPDFQTAWVDRWWELRKTHFSLDNINRIIDGYANELMEAQDRNFKKWTSPRPRGGYQAEVNLLKTWLKTRVEWLDSQMITVPKFTPTEAVHEGEISVALEATGGSVTPAKIYYTTDGTDPRAPGGAPSDKATLYDGKPIVVSKTTKINARKHDPDYKPHKDGPTMFWSGMSTQRYFIGNEPAGASNLVISEIMYNPDNPSNVEKAAGFTEADAFEFIEMLNIGAKTIDLSGARVSDGVDFRFPEGTVLEKGKRLVIAANKDAFARRYGQQVVLTGVYAGTLRNGGEEIVVRDYNGQVIARFDYNDEAPWPLKADGKGNSLFLKSPTSKPDPTQAASWADSASKNGSPGLADASEGQVAPPVGTGYAAWLAANFSAAQLADANVSGPTADADNDKLTTLVEYFAGGHPLKSEADRLPKVKALFDPSSGPHLLIIYTRKPGLTDVKAEIELSTDLQTWQATAPQGAETVVKNADGTEAVSVAATRPLGPEGRRFIRLKITKQ